MLLRPSPSEGYPVAVSASSEPPRRRVLRVLSWIAAAVLGLALLALLEVTAGWGGLAAALALAGLGTWWAWKRWGLHGRAWTAVACVALTALVWDGTTLVDAIRADNGETFSQKATSWARDHGLGRVIDWLEGQVYDTPPSADPADELALDLPTTTEPDSSPATTESAVTTTTIYAPPAPEPLVPVLSTPLQGEGLWLPIQQVRGVDVMWATSIRPVRAAGSVVATVVAIDQTYLRVAMFNGREPSGDWARDDHVPQELWPALLATMNGGFRLEHTYGGYKTEGVVVQELIPGRATLAIGPEGKLVIGELGRDVFDDGSWLTLRQNLVLLVDQGQPGIEKARQQRVYWGAHSSGEIFVNRSAVCERYDGKLAFVMAGRVDAPMFAQILIDIGCYNAVQLDINGAWPDFAIFGQNTDGTLSPFQVDRRMNSDPMRYLESTGRDFFAFFDAELVPEQSILDI